MTDRDEQGERLRSGETPTGDRPPELDVVTDPRRTPPRVSMFDPDDDSRWIRTDEGHLVDLATVR